MASSTAEQNVELVESFLDALNHWDFDRLAGIVDENVVFTIPFGPEEFVGHVEGRENWFATVKDWSTHLNGSENLHEVRVDSLASSPDQVIAFYKSDMEMKNGYRYKNDYIGRFVVTDGRVTRFDEYFDSVPFVFSLGGTITFPDANRRDRSS
jgi:ketosteroid isomerase-like protein